MNLIRPEDVVAAKAKATPQEVYDAFNKMITKHWSGYSAHFTQEEVIETIIKGGKINENQLFNHNWLDVEDAYRAIGWIVKYDRPAYNETGNATFDFRKGKTH